MTKLKRLKKEALAACEFRGHKMKRFISYNPVYGFTSLTTAYSHCRICGRQVLVQAKPLPNGIEIGGEAVALTCDD